jgi:hypothetical protein
MKQPNNTTEWYEQINIWLSSFCCKAKVINLKTALRRALYGPNEMLELNSILVANFSVLD